MYRIFYTDNPLPGKLLKPMSTQVSNRFSLREVAELTGLSEFTLRGWEGRYSAVSPIRTPTGRRLYRTEDVVKLNLLKDLVGLGHRIGDIAALSDPKLRKLLSAPRMVENQSSRMDPEIQKIFENGERFAWDEIRLTFEQARMRRKGGKYLQEFLLPFLREMTRRIGLGQISISLEHIFSSMIKEELARIRTNIRIPKSSHRFILCTPEGDHHELGLLIAYTLLNLNGISSLYLGPHVPKQELCETALRYGATHILVTSTLLRSEGAVEDPLKLISFLNRHLPQFSNLWVAGRGFQKLSHPKLGRLEHLASFEDLVERLEQFKLSVTT